MALQIRNLLDTDGTAIEFQKQGLETIATFNSDGAVVQNLTTTTPSELQPLLTV